MQWFEGIGGCNHFLFHKFFDFLCIRNILCYLHTARHNVFTILCVEDGYLPVIQIFAVVESSAICNDADAFGVVILCYRPSEYFLWWPVWYFQPYRRWWECWRYNPLEMRSANLDGNGTYVYIDEEFLSFSFLQMSSSSWMDCVSMSAQWKNLSIVGLVSCFVECY